MLEQSTSNGSRGKEDLEPLQKRLKIIEDRQDQLLGTVEELLKQVRKAPASPIHPSLLLMQNLPLCSIEWSPFTASFTTATLGLQEY